MKSFILCHTGAVSEFSKGAYFRPISPTHLFCFNTMSISTSSSKHRSTTQSKTQSSDPKRYIPVEVQSEILRNAPDKDTIKNLMLAASGALNEQSRRELFYTLDVEKVLFKDRNVNDLIKLYQKIPVRGYRPLGSYVRKFKSDIFWEGWPTAKHLTAILKACDQLLEINITTSLCAVDWPELLRKETKLQRLRFRGYTV